MLIDPLTQKQSLFRGQSEQQLPEAEPSIEVVADASAPPATSPESHFEF